MGKDASPLKYTGSLSTLKPLWSSGFSFTQDHIVSFIKFAILSPNLPQ